MMIAVNSFQDFESGITGKERAFLLLYKKGTERSECSFTHVAEADKTTLSVFYADVTVVHDIHERFGILTVPALLEFRDGVLINTLKGCNDAAQYKALFENTIFQAGQKDDVKSVRRITVYSTPACSWCNTLKTYLKLHNIAYTDIDVSRDQKAADAMVKRSGQMGVPQTDINGEIIVGFNKLRINQLLGIRE